MVAVVHLRDDVEVASRQPVAGLGAAILRVPGRQVVAVERIVRLLVDGGTDAALRLAAVDHILALLVGDDRERHLARLRAREHRVRRPVASLCPVADILRRGDDALDVVEPLDDLEGL